jgi:uncharacterized phage-associated protein
MEMNTHSGPVAPRVHLKPNVAKIIAAISYVIALGDIRRMPVTQYDILKTVFIADKSHLNRYGRPVTFDNYYAMRAGPVPSLSYDLLKEKQTKLRQLHLRTLPWKRQDGSGGRYFYTDADTHGIDDSLSDSDKDALKDAFATIKSLTFGQIIGLTHDDPAYKEAWRGEGEQNAFLMSLGMLFDTPNFDEAEALEFLSKHM